MFIFLLYIEEYFMTEEKKKDKPEKEEVKVKKIVDVLKKQNAKIKELEKSVTIIPQLEKAVNDLNRIIQQFLQAFNNHIHVASPTIVQSKDIVQDDELKDLE